MSNYIKGNGRQASLLKKQVVNTERGKTKCILWHWIRIETYQYKIHICMNIFTYILHIVCITYKYTYIYIFIYIT